MNIPVLLNNKSIYNCIYKGKKVAGVRLEFYFAGVSLPLCCCAPIFF
jgi:hypothetical protein